MKDRTAQDLLAERRALIKEQVRETDQLDKACLQNAINEIDAELDRRHMTGHLQRIPVIRDEGAAS